MDELQALFQPESIAVIGASKNETKKSTTVESDDEKPIKKVKTELSKNSTKK